MFFHTQERVRPTFETSRYPTSNPLEYKGRGKPKSGKKVIFAVGLCTLYPKAYRLARRKHRDLRRKRA
jgi:hypothetical protein